MRHLLTWGFSLLLLSAISWCPSASTYSSPGTASGFVNDFAGMLTPTTRSTLEQRLQQLNQDQGIQIAVATIESLGDETIESYAVQLFAEWGIGHRDQDSGILLLIAKAERQARLEVGYGLEGALPDATADQILRTKLKPAFKENRYDDGVTESLAAVISAVENEDFSASAAAPTGRAGPAIAIGAGLLIIGGLIWAVKKYGPGSSATGRRATKEDAVDTTPTSSSTVETDSPASESGGSDFGGGESGGGGASESW